jgi:hypothetical protein
MGAAAGAALTLASASGFAAEPALAGSHAALAEMETAQFHTGYAAEAKDLAAARNHLQDAQNCLVGPGGAGYSTASADPCSGQGAGVLADVHDPLRASIAEAALSQVRRGIQATTLADAQQSARDATRALRLAGR